MTLRQALSRAMVLQDRARPFIFYVYRTRLPNGHWTTYQVGVCR